MKFIPKQAVRLLPLFFALIFFCSCNGTKKSDDNFLIGKCLIDAADLKIPNDFTECTIDRMKGLDTWITITLNYLGKEVILSTVSGAQYENKGLGLPLIAEEHHLPVDYEIVDSRTTITSVHGDGGCITTSRYRLDGDFIYESPINQSGTCNKEMQAAFKYSTNRGEKKYSYINQTHTADPDVPVISDVKSEASMQNYDQEARESLRMMEGRYVGEDSYQKIEVFIRAAERGQATLEATVVGKTRDELGSACVGGTDIISAKVHNNSIVVNTDECSLTFRLNNINEGELIEGDCSSLHGKNCSFSIRSRGLIKQPFFRPDLRLGLSGCDRWAA